METYVYAQSGMKTGLRKFINIDEMKSGTTGC